MLSGYRTAKAQLIEERVVVVEKRLGIETEVLWEQGLSARWSQKD